MKIRLIAGAAALAVTVAACGGSSTETAQAEGAALAPAATNQPATIDVLAASSSLGDILVGPDGLTLYAFTNDTQAASTCYGTCADAWPPVIVSEDWTAGPGLDFGIFATTKRDDGQLQLVAGQWPLYYFAGDAVPGDVNGQGSGNVWFAVDLDGRLIQDEASAAPEAQPADDGAAPAADEAAAPADAPVTVGTTSLGDALVDTDGLTLYGFLTDVDGTPTCNDACADAWPPAFVDGPDLPAGLDPEVFSVVPRADGSFQLKAGKWPLYRFAGDAAPGDVNGQGSGDVWFVTAPDGSLIGASAAEGPTESPAPEASSDAGSGTERDY